MVERVKKIPAHLLELWNKFTSKQKTIIICVALAVLLLLVGVSYFISRPEYTVLQTCETTAEASKIVELLRTDSSIDFKTSKDGMVIYVEDKDRSNALLLMGKEGIPKLNMTTDELLSNSLSTTESDRQLKSKIYLQQSLNTLLSGFKGVESAVVNIGDKEVDNTVLAETKERTVSVFLNTTNDFNDSIANAIANIVAGSVGNTSTEKITISNQNGMLFTGGSETGFGSANTVMKYKNDCATYWESKIAAQLQKQGYDEASVIANFSFDMDEVESVATKYSPPIDGQKTGIPDTSYVYKATNESGTAAGVPGTDTNSDETGYTTSDGGSAGSKVESDKKTYKMNEEVTKKKSAIGAIIPSESSMSIVLNNYKTYREEDLKKDGTLDGTTFTAYAEANSTSTAVQVDQNLVNMVAAATGIPAASISIQAYDVPIFEASTESSSFTNYLMIILAVLIVALLLFVVFKGTAPVEVTELEPELSVEQLLATTRENQSLDDVEFGDKSETRKMIEKFVEENPEAVAQLLRNWLNDDWG